jgi:hypothetical protein
MAIGHISYDQIPQQVRALAAARARQQIRTAMTNNFLTPQQHAFLQERLVVIDKWEQGQIKTAAPPALPPVHRVPALPPAPTHHEIGVEDGLDVGGTVG